MQLFFIEDESVKYYSNRRGILTIMAELCPYKLFDEDFVTDLNGWDFSEIEEQVVGLFSEEQKYIYNKLVDNSRVCMAIDSINKNIAQELWDMDIRLERTTVSKWVEKRYIYDRVDERSFLSQSSGFEETKKIHVEYYVIRDKDTKKKLFVYSSNTMLRDDENGIIRFEGNKEVRMQFQDHTEVIEGNREVLFCQDCGTTEHYSKDGVCSSCGGGNFALPQYCYGH